MKLHTGNMLIDNDPRMKGRKVMIIAVGDTHVIGDSTIGSRRVSIAIRRIHDDGKPRKSGFSLVR